MDIRFCENGIYLHIQIEGDVRLLNLSGRDYLPEGDTLRFRLVEVQETGMNQDDHHGRKHTGTSPGLRFLYVSHRDYRNTYGRKLEITMRHEGLFATCHLQFFDGVSVVRSWTELSNKAEAIRRIEYVSSFALTGIDSEANPRDTDARIHLAHNTWFGECQWRSYTLSELGYYPVNDFSMKRVAASSAGTWPASEFLPMGCYERDGYAYTWQIETSASWHFEISDIVKRLYLQLSGPSFAEHGFIKRLCEGESFVSEACAVGFTPGFQPGIRELTKYRRLMRRENGDNAAPKVIFNDYMNCLSGDPTTEKLIPLIDAAAEAGCEYFCIDAGWYADGEWWDGVGEWIESARRFPGGIKEPIDYIRQKGMIPGLWLELEVMGINCPLAEKAKAGRWFFERDGIPVIDHGRYQLDFRNENVRAHASEVIRRLVSEYGVGYIKMDYNNNFGPGTDQDADSAAEGLLAHTRSYLDWLGGIFALYPGLIIENCGSGGMRMTYPLLFGHSIQSVTDQTDYIKMAAIACNCMTACPPEQAAIWSYPTEGGHEEETAFNMVNAILLRVHQSGRLDRISSARRKLVEEGIAYHRSIVNELKRGLPFWPVGLAAMWDDYLCVGLECGEKLYIAVWRTGLNADEAASAEIPLPGRGRATVKLAYPQKALCEYQFNEENRVLRLRLPPRTARIFEAEPAY